MRASVLDEEMEEDQGVMLIATPNDEFNTLAAIRAVESRDRSQVFQFAPSSGSELAATRSRARLLVSPSFSFITASEQMLSGGVFRSTPLTGQFTFRDYRDRYGERATPMFLVESGRIVGVFSADWSLSPSPGQSVISLIASKTPKPAVVDEEEVVDAMRENKPSSKVV